ncbi:MAG: NADAR family protein [Mariniblastus sp.]
MTEPIKFYSVNDEYGEFSNFAAYPIKIGKKMWPTSEHFFQAMKFKNESRQNKIRKTKTPMLAAQMGRDRKFKLRRDWESAKCNVMFEALMAKFTQYDELKKLLLDTDEAKIIEHTENDSYWGDGGDGSGKNMLGRILMKVRTQIRESENPSNCE